MRKHLLRSKDGVIAGVCGGIAEYIDTDPTAIRVLWVVLTVFTALIPGIIAYLICWILIPER
jgi:phage shock protein C